jgi:hypothetical protein
MCAGYNGNGQLGRTGPQTDTTVAPTSAGITARRIAASARHTCAIANTGALWCWGGGGGNSAGISGPRLVSAGLTFSEVYVADETLCALQNNGTLHCADIGVQSPIGERTLIPFSGSLRFSQALLGAAYRRLTPNAVEAVPFTCAITLEGVLYCWGDYPPLVLSSRRGDSRFVPVRIAPGTKFRSIAADRHHLCGVTTALKLVCM